MNSKRLFLLALFFLMCNPLFAQQLHEFMVPNQQIVIDTTRSFEENLALLREMEPKVEGLYGEIVDYTVADSIVLYSKTVLLNSSLSSSPDYGSSNGEIQLIDKFAVRPEVGGFDNMLQTGDDLNSGKVAVSIPLFVFKYFDYNIPISINNQYPEKIRNISGDPLLYTGSRVGGDWNLSVESYKVSRSVKGINDDNTSKGYFTSYSQSKANGTNNISNDDVYKGLKGDWDTSPDIYSFNTPTISGSFLLDLNNNTFQNLTDGSFYVTFARTDGVLTSFTITDDQGNKYSFGSLPSAIEVTKSRTYVQNFFRDKGNKPKFILVFKENNAGEFKLYDVNGVYETTNNFYLNCGSGTPYSSMDYNDIIQAIHQNEDELPSYMTNGIVCPMGNTSSSNGNYRYYAIPQFVDHFHPFDSLHQDSDLAQPNYNSGWYLTEIQLLNGKKIFLNYTNKWVAYTVHTRSRVEIQKADGNPTNVDWSNTYFYPYMPFVLDPQQAPVNESIANTDVFVKTPILTQMIDEDGISMVQIDNIDPNLRTPRPYVVSPVSLSNSAPSDVVSGADYNPSLMKKIHFENRNDKNIDVIFNQTMNPALYNITNSNGTVTSMRVPWLESSTLDKVSINNVVEYNFEYYPSGLLKKIIYPTKGEKQFKYVEWPRGNVNFDVPVLFSSISSTQPTPIYRDFFVDEITTVSENNTQIEKYERDTPIVQTEGKRDSKNYNGGDFNASIISTENLNSNVTYRNGVTFANAKKYVNTQLKTHSIFKNESIYYTSNPFYKVGQSTPLTNHTTYNIYEDKRANFDKEIHYKRDSGGNDLEIARTEAGSTNYSAGNLLLPAVYLKNMECGPYNTINGSYTNRGYSRYYFPTNVEKTSRVTKTKQLFSSTNILQEDITKYFKRFKNAIGTNSRVLHYAEYANSKGEYWRDNYVYNFDVPYINFTSEPLTKLRVRNLNPPLETIKSKYYAFNANPSVLYQFKPIDISVVKYKLNQNGSNVYPVKASDLKAETNDVVNMLTNNGSAVNPSGLASVYQDPTDVNNILYDNKIKEKMIYDRYDALGRVIEYHSPEGIYTSIIWGYEDQYPIAKIENAKYADIDSFAYANLKVLSNQDNDDCRLPTCKEEILRKAFSDFRIANAGKNWMITTYTFDYTIGMTSITNTTGDTSYFEYDSMHRLKRELDSQGNVLKEYEYNYKH